jgi:hypothetical protein
MTRVTVGCGVLLLVVAGGVWAEQIGGPSGPGQGELRLGAEGNFRDHVEGLVSSPAAFITGRDESGVGAANFPQPQVEELRLSTHTFYGVLDYGLTDRLSVRAKAGMGKVGIDAAYGGLVTDDLYDFGYGLAWSAGLQYRICAPAGQGTSLALSGQFARCEPDDVYVHPYSQRLGGAELQEITAALTVGTSLGHTRPYAGIVWSDLDFDFTITPVLQRVSVGPGATQVGLTQHWSFEKDDTLGAVFGLDQGFGGTGWLNLEARVWDEASFAATVGASW